LVFLSAIITRPEAVFKRDFWR